MIHPLAAIEANGEDHADGGQRRCLPSQADDMLHNPVGMAETCLRLPEGD